MLPLDAAILSAFGVKLGFCVQLVLVSASRRMEPRGDAQIVRLAVKHDRRQQQQHFKEQQCKDRSAKLLPGGKQPHLFGN